MTPIKQRYGHEPDKDIWGDCHRAAIASLFDLSLDEVPHFADGGPDGDEFTRRVREWLLFRGLIPILVPYNHEDLAAVLSAIAALNPGVYYLLGGRSPRGVNHTVVCLDDAIVHDPSPNEIGIAGPCDDDCYWVTFFSPMNLFHSRTAA